MNSKKKKTTGTNDEDQKKREGGTTIRRMRLGTRRGYGNDQSTNGECNGYNDTKEDVTSHVNMYKTVEREREREKGGGGDK